MIYFGRLYRDCFVPLTLLGYLTLPYASCEMFGFENNVTFEAIAREYVILLMQLLGSNGTAVVADCVA